MACQARAAPISMPMKAPTTTFSLSTGLVGTRGSCAPMIRSTPDSRMEKSTSLCWIALSVSLMLVIRVAASFCKRWYSTSVSRVACT
jgi:hypothetical protein